MGLDAAKASRWNSSKTVNTLTLSQYLQAVEVDCLFLQILCKSYKNAQKILWIHTKVIINRKKGCK